MGNSPFDRGAQGTGDGFNPFRDKPPMNNPAPAASFEKAPPKTTTFNSTAALSSGAALASNRASEEAQLRAILDRLGRPNAILMGRIIQEAAETGAYSDIISWLADRKNRYGIPHRLAAAGYTPVRNPARGTGLWRIGRVRQVVYARQDLPVEEQVKAVRALRERYRFQNASALGRPAGQPLQA